LVQVNVDGRPRLARGYDRPAMPARRAVDLAQTRAAVLAVTEWLRDETQPAPAREALAAAVRLTARTLAVAAPGASVELRIPPFVAVQCISGPQHRRGTPPNVVETDPRTWLLLAAGLLSASDAMSSGALQLSGSRAGDVASYLPLVRLDER
jgi:Bacterial SCP ortholog